MKLNYSHLNKVNYSRYDYSKELLIRCTSKIFWQSTLLMTFMLYLQSIILLGARRIKYIQNYQNPIR